MEHMKFSYRRRIKKRCYHKKRIIKVIIVMLLVLAAIGVAFGFYIGNIIFDKDYLRNRNILPATNRSVPLLLQTDQRWGNKSYGNSTISVSGCGPTCLSMVIIGITDDKDATPDVIAHFSEKNGYYINGTGTSWKLMTEGAKKLGLDVNEIPLSERNIAQELNEKNPIICSMRPGDFTDEGHFIVLIEYTDDGMIRLNDPNSVERSEKLWDYEKLASQISILWSYK